MASGAGTPARRAGAAPGRARHSDEAILAAVRDLLLDRGPRGVTTAAVSQRSGAPTGSLYHRFGSRSAMVAELWIRTIRRFHAHVLAAAALAPPGTGRALAVADAIVEFAARHPQDATLMLVASQAELTADESLPDHLAAAVRTLNEPVEDLLRQLAREVYGRVTREGLQRLSIAVINIPYTAIRRRLLQQGDPGELRGLVREACRAMLAPVPEPDRQAHSDGDGRTNATTDGEHGR